MNAVKFFHLFVTLLFCTYLWASATPWPQVTEGYWVGAPIARFRELLEAHPELTVDQVRAWGFEIYGPVGLGQFLQSRFPALALLNLEEQNKSNQNTWPTPEASGQQLQQIAATFPLFCHLFSIGKSENGREIWALKISRHPKEDLLLPEIKFVANMHGDEILGRDLLVRFARDILTADGEGNAPEITQLINNSELFLLPSLNPDGAAVFRRGNQRQIDLNRDFPRVPLSKYNSTPSSWAQETQLMIAWQQQRHFALSANFHSGNLVVNYPWDYNDTPHPFSQLLQALALSYANVHPAISRSHEFTNGIVQGSDWYVIDGSMQDWSTYYHHDLQVTIEISDTKIPPYSQLERYYQQNRASLIRFWQMSQRGMGFVTGPNSDRALLELSWRDQEGKFTHSEKIEFNQEIFLPLLPGDYHGQLHFVGTSSAQDQAINFRILDDFSPSPNYIHLHF